MKRAAIGVRMHSGWGALIGVSERAGTVEIVERRRIAVISSSVPGAMQPYHFARSLQLPEAERFIAQCFAASTALALAAIQDVVGALHARQYRLVGCAVLLASGRPLPHLSKILAAHPLLHTAEGEFFREVVTKACAELVLPVTKVRERDLDNCMHVAFGKTATKMRQQLTTLGRSLGPPWTADQKSAALAALLIVANRHQ
jgi:hypothetical protein